MKKLLLALTSIALMATSAMADAPATAAPTEVKMKIKAKEKEGTVKAKVSISHDMLTYDQAKKKGKEANFITHITATVADKVVYDASTSQFLSKNPLIKFKFAGKKGDELKITYTQLKGEVFFATKKIK
jgi:sulfur-oxidizing protein SoxZ